MGKDNVVMDVGLVLKEVRSVIVLSQLSSLFQDTWIR